MMLSADSCDPSVEICNIASALERPSGDAFYGLMLGYVAQVWSPFLSVLVSILLVSGDPDIDIGYEVLLFLNMVLIKFYVFFIPFFLQFIYGIPGSNFFLSFWVDEVLAYWILPRFIPNMTFWLLIVDLAIFAFLNRLDGGTDRDLIAEFNTFHRWVFICQISQDLYLWNSTMKKGRDSVRFVDPTWNEIGPGELLWPSFFYTLGLTEKRSAVYEDSQTTFENPLERDNNDKIFTL